MKVYQSSLCLIFVVQLLWTAWIARSMCSLLFMTLDPTSVAWRGIYAGRHDSGDRDLGGRYCIWIELCLTSGRAPLICRATIKKWLCGNLNISINIDNWNLIIQHWNRSMLIRYFILMSDMYWVSKTVLLCIFTSRLLKADYLSSCV